MGIIKKDTKNKINIFNTINSDYYAKKTSRKTNKSTRKDDKICAPTIYLKNSKSIPFQWDIFKVLKASCQLPRTKILPGQVLKKSFKELEEFPLVFFN